MNRCDELRLELARWFTTWFQAGGRPTASRREESLHTRTQYHQQQQTALCAALQVYHISDFGDPWGKNATPYDNCVSAGHLAFGKDVALKAGT